MARGPRRPRRGAPKGAPQHKPPKGGRQQKPPKGAPQHKPPQGGRRKPPLPPGHQPQSIHANRKLLARQATGLRPLIPDED